MRFGALDLRFLFFLFGLVLVLPGSAWAESARSLTSKGNELYSAGKYDEALRAYEEAEPALPESPEIQFNKGDAYFQLGDHEKARGAYESAALKAEDLSLEAKSQFNMGDIAFSDGQRLLANDPKKALEKYQQGIAHFREALRIDPALKEAAENIELTRLRIKELQDQMKKQEEEKREQQKEKEASRNPDAPKEDEQEEQDSERQGQDQEDNTRSEQDSSRDAGEQAQNKGTPSPGEEKREEQSRARRADKADEEKMQPAELAKEILREEKQNRLQRDRVQRGGYQPVEKDW